MPRLYEAMEKNCRTLGIPFREEISMIGCTDMGDVSFKIPAIHAMTGLDGCENMAMHTKEFVAQTACDIITSADLLCSIKTEFERAKKVRGEGNS